MGVVCLKIGDLIGRGYQCEVFALGDDKVLKVFKPGADRSWIEREFQVTCLLHGAGLPVPAAFDIVEVDGRTGIVYERIHGPLISEAVLAKPGEIRALARGMAELHAAIHSVSLKDLPSQRERFIRRIKGLGQLTAGEKEDVLLILDRLPDGDRVCHGDLNPNNVIVSPKGMVAIDWDNGCRGNPMADVARTVLLLDNAPCHVLDPLERKNVCALARRFRDEYLEVYFETTGETAGRSESLTSILAQWMIPVAAARLDENIEPEQAALLETVRKGVARQA